MCPSNCISCTTAGNCTGCVANYGLKTNDGADNTCEACEDNLKVCSFNNDNVKTWTTCIDGYRLVDANDTCEECTANSTCSGANADITTVCNDGYYLKEDD